MTINWDLYTSLDGICGDTVIGNIDEDYERIPIISSTMLRELRQSHAISSVKKRTAPGSDRIRTEHLKNLSPVLINTLVQLFTRYLSACNVSSQLMTTKRVLLYKKRDVHGLNNVSLEKRV
ncbi:unnamed protein product [Heligmosomoides polygyrus]|uniref:Uncharacterized protein n=1 Tax=Heligmosomoides polygyrus TaxID=6339 RepID=A0A183FV90_HELPZ|nr:unnamed protein product [Heligmosomoides polygyrus]